MLDNEVARDIYVSHRRAEPVPEPESNIRIALRSRTKTDKRHIIRDPLFDKALCGEAAQGIGSQPLRVSEPHQVIDEALFVTIPENFFPPGHSPPFFIGQRTTTQGLLAISYSEYVALVCFANLTYSFFLLLAAQKCRSIVPVPDFGSISGQQTIPH